MMATLNQKWPTQNAYLWNCSQPLPETQEIKQFYDVMVRIFLGSWEEYICGFQSTDCPWQIPLEQQVVFHNTLFNYPFHFLFYT